MSWIDRYRTLPRQQRVLWIVGPVAIAIGIAMAIWWGLSASVGKPLWTTLAFDARSPRSVLVTYEVTRPTDSTVVCSLAAKQLDHATVGRLDDTIPPGEPKSVVRKVEIRTASQAVMGEVVTCRAQ